MNPTDIPLFDLLDRRLRYLDARQGVLSQNVSNADTPGYVARDLPPFARLVSGASLAPTRTSSMHLASETSDGRPRTLSAERAPDGNGVRLDEQLTRIAETDSAHELASTLYRRYLGLFRIAIGK